MELFNTSTPDKAFKTSVRPLAGLIVFQAIGLLFIFTSWPAEQLSKAPVPFMSAPANKYFLIANAIFLMIVGIGLFLRSRPVWLLFLAYLVIAPIFLIMGMAFDFLPGAEPKTITIPVAIIFSAVMAAGLYIVTKPAFKKVS